MGGGNRRGASRTAGEAQEKVEEEVKGFRFQGSEGNSADADAIRGLTSLVFFVLGISFPESLSPAAAALNPET
jgi:hypothetical protein